MKRNTLRDLLLIKHTLAEPPSCPASVGLTLSQRRERASAAVTAASEKITALNAQRGTWAASNGLVLDSWGQIAELHCAGISERGEWECRVQDWKRRKIAALNEFTDRCREFGALVEAERKAGKCS